MLRVRVSPPEPVLRLDSQVGALEVLNWAHGPTCALDDDGSPPASPPSPAGSARATRSSKTFELPTFPDAIAFVTRIADRAEAANHHPDIDIR